MTAAVVAAHRSLRANLVDPTELNAGRRSYYYLQIWGRTWWPGRPRAGRRPGAFRDSLTTLPRKALEAGILRQV